MQDILNDLIDWTPTLLVLVILTGVALVVVGASAEYMLQ